MEYRTLWGGVSVAFNSATLATKSRDEKRNVAAHDPPLIIPPRERMLQAGVIISDYATLMVEILRDNARPEAGAVYGAMDMPWAKLVGQIAHVYGK